jgi:hypothetical protein
VGLTSVGTAAPTLQSVTFASESGLSMNSIPALPVRTPVATVCISVSWDTHQHGPRKQVHIRCESAAQIKHDPAEQGFGSR